MNTLPGKQSVCVYVGATHYFAQNEILPEYAVKNLEKINNISVRNEKKAAFGVLNFALEHIGIDASVRDCFLSMSGKPIHKRFSFSITHSKGVVAVAVCTMGNLGIDVESAESRKRTDRLLDKILCDGEEEMDSLVLWTKKEAIFKCEGKSKVFAPSMIKTADARTKSIKFSFEEKEFVLTVATEEREINAEFFLAPGGEHLTFSEI